MSLLCNSNSAEDKENVGCGPHRSKWIQKASRTPLGSKNTDLSTKDGLCTAKQHLRSSTEAMDSYTVVLKRGRHGYGFSVLGSCPAKVSSVKQDSAAHFAGLQRSDCIVKINGINVAKSMADQVAKIIRNSEKQIVMDIHRPDTADVMSVTSEISQYPCPEEEPRPRRLTPQSRPLSISSACFNRELSASTMSLQCAIPRVDHALQSMGNQETERDQAVHKLQTLETEFAQLIERGIACYVEPFKSCVISPSEHLTLFQNIDKLLSFSVHHLTKLSDAYSSQLTLQAEVSAGVVYQPWVEAMSDAYEMYCNGIKSAFRLLLELSETSEFKTTLRDLTRMSNGLSLSQFLQKPLMHIKAMVLVFQEIALCTPPEHYDHKHVKFVIETLRSACNRINDNNTRRSPSVLSLASNQSCHRSASPEMTSQPEQPMNTSETESLQSSPQSQSSKATNRTASSSDQSMVSIASVDSEVMDIQTRLVLPDHMPPLQIATATRHMIYSGDLFHFDGLLWKKLFVVLLSDLLLLTQADYDGLLTLWEEPLILDRVESINPQGAQVCEFSIESQVLNGQPPKILQFQAPTVDLKATWINLLEQRVSSFKSQVALAASMDNVV